MSEIITAAFAFVALISIIFLAVKVGAQKSENLALKKEIEAIAHEQEQAKKFKEAIASKSDSDVVKRVRSIKRKKTSK